MDARSSEGQSKGAVAPAWVLRPQQVFWKWSDAARQFRESRKLPATAALGKRGEDLAHRYLCAAGYSVVFRNYRVGGGEAEIDIIASKNGITVFVEVKTRTDDRVASPDRAVGEDKQHNIVRAARHYTARAGIAWNEVRFDVISVVLYPKRTITHHEDAFFEGRAA